MKIVETVVDIEGIIESHCTEKRIKRFGVLCMHFHINLCLRKNCSSCKFVNEFVTFCYGLIFLPKKVFDFQHHFRIHHKEFHDFHHLLMSLVEKEKKVLF